MTKDSSLVLITSDDEVDEIARSIRAAGRFAFDVEFLSADRYIPELCLIQLAWGEDNRCAAIDTTVCKATAIAELVADPDIQTIGHSAKQDLQLLTEVYGIAAKSFEDTQIGAAFCGLGEQMGLGRLIAAVLGRKMDKGAQFTDWTKRPLSDRQLRYAIDDVRYLWPVYEHLREKLIASDRLDWVIEESAVLADACAKGKEPEQMYLNVSGSGSVQGPALGSLLKLAAWRENTARLENKPPSWLMPDAAMVDACKRNVRNAAGLKKLRGIGQNSIRLHGEEILGAISAGRALKLSAPAKKEPLPPELQLAATVLAAAVQGRAKTEGLGARFIGNRADVEDLVRWYGTGAREEQEGSIKLLGSWRREMVGGDLIAWLNGERAVRSDPDVGVRLDS